MNIFDRIKNTLKIPDKINSRQICVVVFVAFPLAILAAIIIKPDNPVSVNENRTLKTGGDIRWEIFDGGFQEDLENCLSDQFPLRDNLKSAETGIRLRLGSGCIGGTYVGSDGRLFQRLLESDVDVDKCVRYAAKINRIAEQTGIETYVMYVPSAGISLRESMPYGAPMYDYDALFSALKRELKSAHVIDLSEALLGRPEYYYATDHHWTAAGAAAAYHEWIAAHGDEPTDEKAPEIITVSSNFRGTLWSRVPNAAIRGEPLWAFRVNDDVIVEADGMEISLYDYSALQTKDKYNFFEGGNHGILTLTNPNVKNGRTLMILKDSFANSFLPCIAGDYSKIIMVDERYAFIDAGQLAVDTGADEIAVIREIISVG
ncbi:MAG: hypothetical protein IIZ08_05665 [Clostridia bacterium]|nr:hypothetical protein [Clostridia bacterium]